MENAETIQQQIEDVLKRNQRFLTKRCELDEQISEALDRHTESCKTCEDHREETAHKIKHMEASLHQHIEDLENQHGVEVKRLHDEDKRRAGDHSLETMDHETAKLLRRRHDLIKEFERFHARWQTVYGQAPDLSVHSQDGTPGRRSSQADQSSVSQANVVSTRASDPIQNPTDALDRAKADIAWERAPPTAPRTRPRNVRGPYHDTAPEDFIMQTNDHPIIRWNDSPHVWWQMRCTVCKANATSTGDESTFFKNIEALRVHVTEFHPDIDAAMGARELWCEVSEIPPKDIESMESGRAPITVSIVPYAGHAVEQIIDVLASFQQQQQAEENHDEPNLPDTALDQSIPRDRGRPLTRTNRRANPRPEGTYLPPARREPRNQGSVNDPAPNALNKTLKKAKSMATIGERRQENFQENFQDNFRKDFEEKERVRGANRQQDDYMETAPIVHQTRARVKGTQADRT